MSCGIRSGTVERCSRHSKRRAGSNNPRLVCSKRWAVSGSRDRRDQAQRRPAPASANVGDARASGVRRAASEPSSFRLTLRLNKRCRCRRKGRNGRTALGLSVSTTSKRCRRPGERRMASAPVPSGPAIIFPVLAPLVLNGVRQQRRQGRHRRSFPAPTSLVLTSVLT